MQTRYGKGGLLAWMVHLVEEHPTVVARSFLAKLMPSQHRHEVAAAEGGIVLNIVTGVEPELGEPGEREPESEAPLSEQLEQTDE